MDDGSLERGCCLKDKVFRFAEICRDLSGLGLSSRLEGLILGGHLVPNMSAFCPVCVRFLSAMCPLLSGVCPVESRRAKAWMLVAGVLFVNSTRKFVKCVVFVGICRVKGSPCAWRGSFWADIFG
jgi:hypothetical protein